MLKNSAVDFVEICNVGTGKVIIKAAKRILNSDKIYRSYCDFYFGFTFWNTLYFGLFLCECGCHGNSLGSIENLYSISEFADPKNPPIDANIVSISCTEMKLWLFECFA